MIRALALTVALAGGLAAQTFATVPNVASFQDVDRPFAGGIGRYQQWYSAASLQAHLPEPMRLQQVEFFAGVGLSTIATTIDCEILLGYGHASGVGSTFNSNFATTPVVVAPRQNRQLSAGASGAVVMTIPFTTLFTWDRQRPLLLEIRIYGNGQNNQPFIYNFRGSTVAIGQTSRVYQGGSAGAASGIVSQGVGMITRFSARPGAVVDFGSGCVGGGGVTPQNVVVQVPSPGIVWQHQLINAASQQICLWVIGDDRTQVDGLPLPLDFPAALGFGPTNCFLRTNVLTSGFYITIGGGPGQGFASFDWQLPAVSSYVGFSFYSQWFVLDPLSPNGVMTATQGVHSIVAPVGG